MSVNNDQDKELLSYAEVRAHIKNQDDQDVLWKFKHIVGHQGPLLPKDPDYKGSMWNVMMEWENGEITTEPLSLIAADDPVTCAIYAKDKGLLDTKGWKRFKNQASRHVKFIRMINQAKLRSYRTAKRYKYGFEIPKNYKDAMRLDKLNGNTKWANATKQEMDCMANYQVFQDIGYKAKTPSNYQRIRVHLIYDVMHDGRHRARLVANGNLTDVPTESVYSGVVSLQGLRMLLFLAELNDMETWSADITSAYLEAITAEKVCITAGPEFGELEGHTLIIYKALYRLRCSGKAFHLRLATCLRTMGFAPCKSEPDIWLREKDGLYEYVAVYVDDLAIASKDPTSIVADLVDINKGNFKIKSPDSIAFHLGCDFFRDEDGTLCFAPRKYIEKMVDNYQRIFGSKPQHRVSSPLDENDHLEIDDSPFLDEKGIQQYQSLIGSMQWAVSIGRLDIFCAIMTLSSFRVAPCEGHLERAKCIICYLSKMKHATIRLRTEEPDFSALPTQHYDWSDSVYSGAKELLPTDAPKPLGKPVVTTSYVDANLYHCMLTGRAVTGILHFLNQTPIDWYSKKQATVETATYGSEFVGGRICIDQIMDLCTTLRYLGVPVCQVSYIFGDNKIVIDSSIVPHSKLTRRHSALSYHRICKAIAAKIIEFHHIPGSINPADTLSKHWSYSKVWSHLQPLLFWRGDTADCFKDNECTQA